MKKQKTLKEINKELKMLYKQLREAKKREKLEKSGVSENTVRPSTT